MNIKMKKFFTSISTLKSISFSLTILLFLISCGTENNFTPADTIENRDVPPDYSHWDLEDDINPNVVGSISGIVYSPSLTLQYRFPIAKALVYVTKSMPPVIPSRNYCFECIDLLPATPYVITDNHGSFRIDNIAGGEWNLVVQKGQFRRVRRITVIPGQNTEIPPEITTLPSKDDPSQGDTIPKIAVASGLYDWFEDLLAKFGLADLGQDYRYVRGSEEFTLFYNGGRAYGIGIEDFKDFLRRPLETPDEDDLSDFHILFIPCSNNHSDEVLTEPETLDNIRKFVRDGGKLYVSDWSYDFVEQVFPEFIDFIGNDSQIGSAENAIEDFWDTEGNISDADLTAWLSALGLLPVQLLKNWVAIEGTASVLGLDKEGNQVEIVPKEMIYGNVPSLGSKPLNVIFDYGCGRVFFTTYHTIGGHTGSARPDIIAQEMILLYLVLDIGVCTEHVVVPI